MNTVTAPVRPAKSDHALPTAANDAAPANWTAHPLARRLLASPATTPPPFLPLARHQRWDHVDAVPGGFRVDCLRVIRRAVLEPAFAAAQAAGRMDEARTIAAAVTVDDAVDAALRIPTLHPVTTAARQLDPAVWGAAL